MRCFTRMLLVAPLLFLPAPSARAQTAVDPSGHWAGPVRVPNKELSIEVDLARNSQGELAGTLSNPAGGVKGFPLTTVAVEGRSVRFVLKAGAEVSTFLGVLSSDGQSISGDASQGGESVPFSLTRTGDARIAPFSVSPVPLSSPFLLSPFSC